ncbi:MAG: ParM/StbA family protein [Thermaerobacter sp.]|nr:ParM/StbA family protein [Thermaerobacter sp.]
MSQLIAVDAGHGYVKALRATGERLMFPSLIASAPPTVDLGHFADPETVQIDHDRFVVGEPARAYATPLWSRQKAADEDTLRLILVAAAQLGAVGPVQLATGLPLSWFGPQRKAFREALTGFGGTVRLPGHPVPQRLWFESVRVLPQGVAAAVVALANPTYRPGPYIVVDVGYRTTEYLVVEKRPDGKLAYDATQAGSLETGTHAVGMALAAALEREYHVAFTAAEVESSESVFIRGQAVSLAPYRANAESHTAAQLHDQLTEVLDARLDKTAGIVLVGGGSTLLADTFPRATVVPDAQWANAQAYLSAL